MSKVNNNNDNNDNNEIEIIEESQILSSTDQDIHDMFQGKKILSRNNIKKSLDDNKNWYLPLVENIRDKGVDAYALSWQTSEDAFYWNQFNVRLNWWVMFLLAVSSAGFVPILTLIQIDAKWAEILFYIVTVFDLLVVLTVTILQGYQTVYNVNIKIAEHLEKSAKFTALYRLIKDQFSLPLEQRYNASTLNDFVTDRINELGSEKLFNRKVTSQRWNDEVAPKNKDGQIDYDQILKLPLEFNNSTTKHELESDEFIVNMEDLKKKK